MIQNHWARLPAPVRALLTAAALLLGAVALTFAMHNQDTYRTGTWDETSQSLVFGRILQIQNHQSAPGGFLGNYLVEGRDPQQDRYLFRENAPVRPEEYQPYTHQSGLQGLAFGWLNKVYSLINQGGEARERMLYATNSILLYLASLCLAAAAGRAFGPTAGLGFAAAVLCAPWVQRGMKNLYWCLWTWWLPALAGLLVWQLARRRGRVPGWGYGLVFGAVGLRCLCGFEFISDFLILCEAALFAAWVDALVRRAPARPWFFRMVYTGFAAVGGFAAALGVWFAQNVAYFGDAGEAWRSILEAATRHSLGGDASIPAVISLYLTSADPVLQLGPVALPPLALIALGAAGLALMALGQKFGLRPAGSLPALAALWCLGLLAPLSWMVLAKMHCQIHTHLVPILWNFALAPATLTVLGALVWQLARGLRRPGRKNPRREGPCGADC